MSCDHPAVALTLRQRIRARTPEGTPAQRRFHQREVWDEARVMRLPPEGRE
jgi:hypothetical protein